MLDRTAEYQEVRRDWEGRSPMPGSRYDTRCSVAAEHTCRTVRAIRGVYGAGQVNYHDRAGYGRLSDREP